MINKLLTSFALMFFIISILWYYIAIEPTRNDLKSCASSHLEQAETLAKNPAKNTWNLQQQCQFAKPIIESFKQCLANVREKRGYLATETVFRMVISPTKADKKLSEIETTCLEY